MPQFFGKPFWITLAALAAIFGISVLSFETAFLPAVMVVIGLAVFALTLYRLEFGLAALFAELFANSHGHLMSVSLGGFSVGLRMAVFLSVMAGWFVLILAKRRQIVLKDSRLFPFAILAIPVALGFLLGFQQSPAKAFSDGNAYLYLAVILPMLSVQWSAMNRRLLLQVFAAAASWVMLMTLGLVYIFSHVPEFALGEVYRFIRDTRTGELTKMIGGIFRVFLQAQFSVALFFLLLAPLLWVKRLDRRARLIVFLVSSAALSVILVSLSRSFWVALVPAGIVLLALAGVYLQPNLDRIQRAIGAHLLTGVFAIALLLIVIFFPFPRFQAGSLSDLSSLFSARATETTDQAIDSRWKLLDPMVEFVKERPLTGYGFGQEVTFISDDPRVRAENPDGRWTTFALEWGWLELWLKMGILGPLAFLFAFYSLIRGLWGHLETKRAWLGIGLMSGLVFLAVTHIFSPYLNHPLGLGLLLFIVPFLEAKTPGPRKGAGVLAADKLPLKVPQASTAPLTSE